MVVVVAGTDEVFVDVVVVVPSEVVAVAVVVFVVVAVFVVVVEDGVVVVVVVAVVRMIPGQLKTTNVNKSQWEFIGTKTNPGGARV